MHALKSLSSLYLHALSRLLRKACEVQSCNTDQDAYHIRTELEDYYLSFPPHLLEFTSLTCAFQAEAMIWLHGIFLITC
jgi:hypothetical protein